MIKRLVEVGSPGTIINLEIKSDPVWGEGETSFHMPIPDTASVYSVENPATRSWLTEIVSIYSSDSLVLPTLIHCTAGKDRTGVCVAALLSLIGVPHEAIVQEYLQSEGELYPDFIRKMLPQFDDRRWFSEEIRIKLRARFTPA